MPQRIYFVDSAAYGRFACPQTVADRRISAANAVVSDGVCSTPAARRYQRLNPGRICLASTCTAQMNAGPCVRFWPSTIE